MKPIAGLSKPPVDPAILLDAVVWLDQPAVWPALLWALGGARTAIDAFDIDPADVDAMLTDLGDSDRWPLFTVELVSGHRVHLVWRNFDDDSGWDYLLAGSGFAEPVPLARLDGHFRGPGMSWPELLTVARQADAPLDRARRLLLLLPAIGDADLPEEAVATVAEAVAAVGARHEQETVAAQLLAGSGRFWGTPAWADHDGIIMCLGHHSLRGPGTSLDQLKAIAAAFHGRA